MLLGQGHGGFWSEFSQLQCKVSQPQLYKFSWVHKSKISWELISGKFWEQEKTFLMSLQQIWCLTYALNCSRKSSGLERRDRNIQDLKQEQEQPSPVSVLERIRLEEETVEEKIRLLSFDDSGMNLLEKDSVHKFVKKVLDASRLNWTNLMARCNEETSTVILTRRSQQR